MKVKRGTIVLVSLALVSLALVAVFRGHRPGPDVSGLTEDDATATRLVSEYRAGLSLPGLTTDAGLDTDARRWVDHLADTNSLTHDAIKLAGWTEVGENVGRGGTIEIVEQAFEDSPTHEHNLSGDYTHLGVAVAVRADVVWIVQRFGTREVPAVPVSAPTVTLAPATTVTLAPPVLCRRVGD